MTTRATGTDAAGTDDATGTDVTRVDGATRVDDAHAGGAREEHEGSTGREVGIWAMYMAGVWMECDG